MRTCPNRPENLISVTRDLTKLQKKVEDELKVETEKRNKDMREKRLANIRTIQETEHSQSQDIGQMQGRRQGQGPGPESTARPTGIKRKAR